MSGLSPILVSRRHPWTLVGHIPMYNDPTLVARTVLDFFRFVSPGP
jgi:hypothetical protein